MGTINTEQIDGLTGIAPVYRHYAGQPQPAYIEMDDGGVVSAGYNANVGPGVTPDVWYGVTLRWTISPYLTSQGIRDLVQDYRDELQRVHDGHEIIWRDTNRVGRLTSDATEAFEAIWNAFDGSENEYEYQTFRYYTAEGWFDGDTDAKILAHLGITSMSPEHIRERVAEYEDRLAGELVMVDDLTSFAETVSERVYSPGLVED